MRASSTLMMMKKNKTYQPELIESLRNPREPEEYLNVALEEDDLNCFCCPSERDGSQGDMARLAEKRN
jgi:hypothetical protein